MTEKNQKNVTEKKTTKIPRFFFLKKKERLQKEKS
jgi:hypothetical protein